MQQTTQALLLSTIAFRWVSLEWLRPKGLDGPNMMYVMQGGGGGGCIPDRKKRPPK